MRAASTLDYRDLARRRLPPFLFAYVDGGSYAEVTLRRNLADLERIALRQRVLRDVSKIDLSTELFGKPAKLPTALAPIGLAGMNARRGEVQAVRAAERGGVPFTLSTLSACPIGEGAQAAERPLWFQLYMIRDRGFMRDLIAAGARGGVRLPRIHRRYAGAGVALSRLPLRLAGASGTRGALRRFAQAMRHPL